MSDEFNLDKYHDEYRERVQAMLDEKSKGKEITFAPPEAPRHGQIIDLMQALKQSIEEVRPKAKAIPANEKPPRRCPQQFSKGKAGNTRYRGRLKTSIPAF